jgi:hypothetical protein
VFSNIGKIVYFTDPFLKYFYLVDNNLSSSINDINIDLSLFSKFFDLGLTITLDNSSVFSELNDFKEPIYNDILDSNTYWNKMKVESLSSYFNKISSINDFFNTVDLFSSGYTINTNFSTDFNWFLGIDPFNKIGGNIIKFNASGIDSVFISNCLLFSNLYFNYDNNLETHTYLDIIFHFINDNLEYGDFNSQIRIKSSFLNFEIYYGYYNYSFNSLNTSVNIKIDNKNGESVNSTFVLNKQGENGLFLVFSKFLNPIITDESIHIKLSITGILIPDSIFSITIQIKQIYEDIISFFFIGEFFILGLFVRYNSNIFNILSKSKICQNCGLKTKNKETCEFCEIKLIA